MIDTRLMGGFLAFTLALGACSTSSDEPLATAGDQQQTAVTEATPPATEASAPETAGTASALLGTNDTAGDLLVGPDGRSLYGFTNDSAAASTCYGGCAEAWPPVIVDEDWTIGPGLDLGIFATTTRDDGQLQLVAGKWPLYYYAGDAVPGDINGQGSGDVWFLVEPAGSLITEPAPDGGGGAEEADARSDDPVVTSTETGLGAALVDSAGMTLYGFTEDVDGVPSCYEACAEAWPPVIVDELPADLDPAVFSVAERDDGTSQLVAGKWPLYRFAGDAAAGDINGQGSGGVWFVATPDGSLITDDNGSDETEDETEDEAGTDGY